MKAQLEFPQLKPHRRICPCGCGSELPLLRGHRLLVCHAAWQRVPKVLKQDFTGHDSLPSECRRAAADILAFVQDSHPTIS